MLATCAYRGIQTLSNISPLTKTLPLKIMALQTPHGRADTAQCPHSKAPHSPPPAFVIELPPQPSVFDRPSSTQKPPQ